MTYAACITEVDFVRYFPPALGIADLRELNNLVGLLLYCMFTLIGMVGV